MIGLILTLVLNSIDASAMDAQKTFLCSDMLVAPGAETASLIRKSFDQAVHAGTLKVLPENIEQAWHQVISSADSGEGLREVHWPHEWNLNDQPTLLLQSLVGLSQHPYRTEDFGQVILKRDQVLALEAFQSHSQSHNKGLFVAPPGYGKTIFARDFIRSRLSRGGVTLVIADYILAANQLRSLVKSSDGDIRVVTAAAFRNFYFALSAAHRRRFIQSLNTIVYDEAHHVGAPMMRDFLSEVTQSRDFTGYFLGLTATPFHQDIDLQELFEYQTYWSYLDSTPNWGARRNAFEVVDQLYASMAMGELTPIDRLFVLTNKTFATEVPLFLSPAQQNQMSDSPHPVLNQELYGTVFGYLKPLIEIRKKTLLIANSIREAERLRGFLSADLAQPIFAVHSDQDSEVNVNNLSRFNGSARGILISVRMVDEAVNLPDVDLVIDLNSSSSARQFIQRLGRALRLTTGKYDVDFVTLNEIDENTARELIEVVDHLRKGEQLRGGARTIRRDYIATPQTSILELSNEQVWTALESSIREFWAGKYGAWKPYEEAKREIQALGISSVSQFDELVSSGKLPDRIPKAPHAAYLEWTSWGDFLGTGRIATRSRQFRSFADAKEWAKQNNIKTSEEWRVAYEKGKLPTDIPLNVRRTYKDEFTTWDDFLSRKSFLPFVQARAWAHTLGLSTLAEWNVYKRTHAVPEEIPRVPQEFYASEWKGWGDFLGTGNVANRDKKFRSYAEAKAWVREHGIRTQRRFREAISNNELPDDFPRNPNRTYAAEWTGWPSFLRGD